MPNLIWCIRLLSNQHGFMSVFSSFWLNLSDQTHLTHMPIGPVNPKKLMKCVFLEGKSLLFILLYRGGLNL